MACATDLAARVPGGGAVSPGRPAPSSPMGRAFAIAEAIGAAPWTISAVASVMDAAAEVDVARVEGAALRLKHTAPGDARVLEAIAVIARGVHGEAHDRIRDEDTTLEGDDAQTVHD